MTLSLLFPSEQVTHMPIKPHVLSHLSLDRSFETICPDEKQRKYFLHMLSNLTADLEVIRYRQEILKDFQANPTLLVDLISLYQRFEELRAFQKQTKHDDFRINIERSGSIDAARNILAINALCCKRSLLFVRAFAELMATVSIKSSGLKRFAEACQRIVYAEKFEMLLIYCSKYETSHSGGFLDFRTVMDDNGKIMSYQLIDHRHIQITDPDLQPKRTFFRKHMQSAHPCERLYPAKGDSYETLAVTAISALSSLFSSLSMQIFEQFSGIYHELDFYDVGLKYTEMLTDKKIPLCYPLFSMDNTVEIQELYDLYLVMYATDIVPNDLHLTCHQGMLIFGKNGCGKTVYLRSIGCMQVLAQAGLPIPAQAATITPYIQIESQFAEAENDDLEAVGRFEQEVRELATMVNSLSRGALVLLNETFQSTAYEEGALALEQLLWYFSDCGIRWILVSHLRQLETQFDKETATVLYATEEHQIHVYGET